jgi:cytochrome c oxidase subunit 2
MSWRRSILFAWVLAATLAMAGSAQDATPPASGAAHEFKMTAKKYEFDPGTIMVKKGERVKLVITALDKDHGFKIKEFGIEEVLKKGVPTTVEFTADKAGEFPFVCSKFCGFGHGKMKGKLIIEE